MMIDGREMINWVVVATKLGRAAGESDAKEKKLIFGIEKQLKMKIETRLHFQ